MPPRGVAMMMAPEVGPDPVPVRMSPMHLEDSQRFAHARPADSELRRELALGGRRSPGPRRPSRRSDSMLLEHDLPGARGAGTSGASMSPCGLTTIGHVV